MQKKKEQEVAKGHQHHTRILFYRPRPNCAPGLLPPPNRPFNTQALEMEGMDPEIAAMMGFGGFGGGKNK